MATPNITFPAKIEDYMLSGSLNALMLYNFLMGIYTMVYGGTVYVYLSKKPSNTNRRVVLTAISVLYMLAFLSFILQWYFLNRSLIVNGQTRESMFWASLEYPLWFFVMLNILLSISLVISDGLLIWRCYHVWGRSMKVIAIPSFLLVAELGLSVTDIVLDGFIPDFTSAANAALVHNIVTALTFMSLGATVSATFLIGYRIHTASENVGRSRTRYNHIVTIIAESSTVYSLVLLLYAMALVIPPFYTVESPWWDVSFYINATVNVISSLAPTIMVLRLALTNPSNTVSSGTITHISGMDFNNSQQDSSGISGANAPVGYANSSAHVEGDKQGQIPIIGLTKESKMHGLIGQSPV